MSQIVEHSRPFFLSYALVQMKHKMKSNCFVFFGVFKACVNYIDTFFHVSKEDKSILGNICGGKKPPLSKLSKMLGGLFPWQ